MFNERIDTFILRFISHDRNIKTEEHIEAESQIPRMANDLVFKKFIKRAGKYFDWKGKKIFDTACGEGDLVNILAKKGALKVWGIDILRRRINAAKSIAERERET